MKFADTLRQVFNILSGAAIGQAIGLGVLILVSRFVSQEQYGIYFLGLTIATYFVALSGAKYHHAIFVIEYNDIKKLIAAVRYLAFCIVIFLASGFILAQVFFNFFDAVTWYDILLLASAGYLSTLNLFYYNLALRGNKLRAIFLSRVLGPLGGGVLMVIFALLTDNHTYLLIAYLVTQLIIWWQLRCRDFPSFSFLEMKEILVRFKRFPVYLLPAGALETFNSSFLILACTKFFSFEHVAIIGLYLKLVASPQGMICTAISDIFRKKFVEIDNSSERRKRFYTVLSYQLLIAIVAGGVFVFVSMYGIDYIFGEKWKNAGEIFLYMLPSFVMIFWISPFSVVLYVQQGERYDFIVQIILTALFCGLFLVSAESTFQTFIFRFNAVICLKYLLELFFCFRSLK